MCARETIIKKKTDQKTHRASCNIYLYFVGRKQFEPKIYINWLTNFNVQQQFEPINQTSKQIHKVTNETSIVQMNLSTHSGGPGPPAPDCGAPQSNRLPTGPSYRALKTAVSALYSVDDFYKVKIGSGFFSEVYKVSAIEKYFVFIWNFKLTNSSKDKQKCPKSMSYFLLLLPLRTGYTQNNRPSNGTENESITFESSKYVARSTIAEQIITSEYFKVSHQLKHPFSAKHDEPAKWDKCIYLRAKKKRSFKILFHLFISI